MTNTYYAQPNNIDAEGFFFEDHENYLAQSQGHTDRFGQAVEEYEFQFIDGDRLTACLFSGLSINQANLFQWFDELENLEHWEMITACYLAEQGYDLTDLLNACLDDVCFFEGTVEDYARDYLESCGLLSELPESLQYYFDYQAFARDLVLGGDVTEWMCPKGTYYVVLTL